MRGARLATALKALAQAERRILAARRRAEAHKARTDTRAWAVERRERTHRLIELGGLVQKSGLAALTEDDRATIYGALLGLADQLRGPESQGVLMLWRRRGRHAFEAEAAQRDREAASSSGAPR